MIEIKRRDQAFQYLTSTDETAARAKSYMVGLDKQEKTIIGLEVLKYKGKERSVAEKDALARSSEAYKEWRAKYEDAVFEFELFRNKRSSETLVIDCWRSENANRRSGNI